MKMFAGKPLKTDAADVEVRSHYDHHSKQWICERCGTVVEPEEFNRHWEENHFPGLSIIDYNEWLW